MAKDILIVPGSSNIEFSGSAANNIKLETLDSGSVAFTSNSGSLFTVTNSLTGSLFSVGDVSGVPILDVNSDDTVTLGQFSSPIKVLTDSSGNTIISGSSTSTGSFGKILGDVTIPSGKALKTSLIKGGSDIEVDTEGAHLKLTSSDLRIANGQQIEWDNANTRILASHASNYMRFDIGGVSNILYLTNSNVGIGNNNPTYKLDVTGDLLVTKTSGNLARFTGAGASSFYISATGQITHTSTTGNLAFAINQAGSGDAFAVDSSALIVKADGKVGIGDSTPSFNLDVSGAGRFTSNLYVGHDTSNIGLYLGNSNSRIYFGGNRAIEGGSSGTLQIGEGFSTLLLQGNTTVQGNMVVTGTLTAQEFITELNTVTIIESSGSTKFGNTNDDLHQFTGSIEIQRGDDVGLKLKRGGQNVAFIGDVGSANDGGLILYDASGNTDILIRTSDSHNSYINTAGKFGLGTASPTGKLEISGDGDSANQLRLRHAGSGTNGVLDLAVTDTEATIIANYSSTAIPLRFYTGAAERVRIDTSGRVGIGTSSNIDAQLHIAGGSWSNSLVIQGNSTVSGIVFEDNSANKLGYVYAADTGIGFLDDDSAWAIRHLTDNYTEFRINNTIYAQLTTTGLAIGSGHTPSYNLDVKGGSSRFIGSGNTNVVYFAGSDGDSDGAIYSDTNQFGLLDGDGAWFIQHTNDTSTGFRINNTQYMQLTTSGLNVTGTGTFSGNISSTATSGNNTFNSSILIAAGKNLFLDGGSNTYIKEGSADVIDIYTGGTLGLKVNASEIQVQRYITHAGDTNTYIDFETDTIGFVTAGSDALKITSAQNVYVPNGKFGVGTNSPNVELDIRGQRHSWGTGQAVKRYAADIAGLADGSTAQYYTIGTIDLTGLTYSNGWLEGWVTQGRSFQDNPLYKFKLFFMFSTGTATVRFRVKTIGANAGWLKAYVDNSTQRIIKLVAFNNFANQVGMAYDIKYFNPAGASFLADADISFITSASGASSTSAPSGYSVVTSQFDLEDMPNRETLIGTDGNGKVGIGTSNVQTATKLELWQGVANGTSYDVMAIDGNTGNYGGMWMTGVWAAGQSGRIGFWGDSTSNKGVGLIGGSGTTPHLYVNGSGNVGIGTTSSTQRLSVRGDHSGDGINTFYHNNTNPAWEIVSYGTDGAYIFGKNNSAAVKVQIRTDGVSYFSGGNVGIGTTTPDSMLEVRRDETGTQSNVKGNINYSAITIQGDYTNGSYLPALAWATADNVATAPKAGIYVKTTNAGSTMILGTSNAYGNGITNEGISIDPSGQVGIGTDTPIRMLDIVASSGDPGIRLESASQSADVITLRNGDGRVGFGRDAITTLISGDVGIGNASPQVLLQVGGNTNGISFDLMPSWNRMFLGQNVKASSTNGRMVRIASSTTDYPSAIAFGYQDVAGFGSEDSKGGINFITVGSNLSGDIDPETYSRMYIHKDGNIGIGTIVPKTRLQVHRQGTTLGQWTHTAIGIHNDTNNNTYSQIGFGYTATTNNAPAVVAYHNQSATAYGQGSLIFGLRNSTSDAAPTERMRVQYDGKVGIGSTTPQQALDVVGGGAFTTSVFFNGRVRINHDGQVHWGAAYNQGYLSWDTNKTYIGSIGSNALHLQSNSSDAIIIDTSQNTKFINHVSIQNNKYLNFLDTGGNAHFRIFQSSSDILEINSVAYGGAVLTVDATGGGVNIPANLDVGAGLDVTGNITVTGTVDGVDIASLSAGTVQTTGNQTIGGTKTLSASPIITGGITFSGTSTIATAGGSDSLSINPDANLHLGTSATDHTYIGASGRNVTLNPTTLTINASQTNMGNTQVAGNLTVTGTVTAEVFETETVVKSIITSTGNTKFGNSTGDTHEMTGSLLVDNGPARISKTLGANTTLLQLDNKANNAAYDTHLDFTVANGATTVGRIASNYDGSNDIGMSFHTFKSTGLGERMRITKEGYVGIGTTTISAALDVNNADGVYEKPVLAVRTPTQPNAIKRILKGYFNHSASTGTYFRVRIPQAYQTLHASGGHIKVTVIWQGYSASRSTVHCYEAVYHTNHGFNSNEFFGCSDFTKTYDQQSPLSYNDYEYDVQPTVTFGRLNSNGHGGLRIQVQGYASYAYQGAIEVEVNGNVLNNACTLENRGTTADSAVVLGLKDQTTIQVTSAGNVGIGTNNPQGQNANGPILHLFGADSTDEPQLVFQQTGETAMAIGVNGNIDGGSAMMFYTNGSNNRMTIREAGNIGIGTNDPDNLLEVYGGEFKITDSQPEIIFERQSDGLKSYIVGDGVGRFNFSYHNRNSGEYIQLDTNPSGGSFIRNMGSGYLALGSNSQDQMFLTSDGKVAIGTSSPGVAKLSVFSSTSGAPFLYVGDGTPNNDGSWDSNIMLDSNQHSRIRVEQRADNKNLEIYAHTGGNPKIRATDSATGIDMGVGSTTSLTIGTNPYLNINGETRIATGLKFTNASSNIIDRTSDGGYLQIRGGNNGGYWGSAITMYGGSNATNGGNSGAINFWNVGNTGSFPARPTMVMYPGVKVGIGTSTVTSGRQLEVASDTDTYIQISTNNAGADTWLKFRNDGDNNSNTDFRMGRANDGRFVFGDGDGDTHYQISSTGEFGIGAAPDGILFRAEKSINGNWAGLIKNTHATNGYGLKVQGGDDASVESFRVSSANDTNYFNVLGDGKVGIGGSPNTNFHIKNTGGIELRLEADTNNSGQEDCFIRFYTDNKTQEGIAGMDNNNSSTLFSSNTENAMVFGTVSNLPTIFATNNTERFHITAGGNVGVGRTPDFKFHVDYGAVSSADRTIAVFQAENSRRIGFVWDDSASTLGLATITSHNLVFHTGGNSNPRMTIDTNGKVGIGTVTNLDSSLVVFESNPTDTAGNAGSRAPFVALRGSSGMVAAFTSTEAAINTNHEHFIVVGGYYGQSGNNILASPALLGHDYTNSRSFLMNYNQTTAINWLDNGNVGIGSTNPDDKLHVQSGTNGKHVFGQAYTHTRSEPATIALQRIGGNLSSPAVIANVGAGSGTILSNIVGTAYSPGGSGNTFHTACGIKFITDQNFGTNIAPGAVTFYTKPVWADGDQERMRISSAGNVGIGTDSPDTKLHIEETTSSTDLIVKLKATNDVYLQFWADGTIGWGLIDGVVGANDFSLYNYPNNRHDITVLSASGNVGIGNTNPAQLLSVGGSIHMTSAGLVGIGLAAPETDLHISNASPAIRFTDENLSNLKHQIIGGGDAGLEYSADFNNVANGYHRWDISGTQKMKLIENGNLGIGGASTPNQKLTVQAGHISLDNDYRLVWGGSTNTSIVGSNANTYLRFFTNSTERLRINNNGTGVGHTNPLVRLHVSDGSSSNLCVARFINPSSTTAGHGSTIQLGQGHDGAYTAQIAAVMEQSSPSYLNPSLRFYTMNDASAASALTERMRIRSNGRIHMGSHTADNGHTVMITGTLHVSSVIRSANDVVAYYSSDERLKKNIKIIENPIEKVKKLRGVEYEWNDKQDIYEEGTKDSGIIAQDVQEVLPQLVKEREDGHLGVRHDRLVGLLIESVKEQQKQIEELKSEIQELKDGSSK